MTNRKLSTMKRITLILISTLAVSLGSLHAESRPWSAGLKLGDIVSPIQSNRANAFMGGAFVGYAFENMQVMGLGNAVGELDVLYCHSQAKGFTKANHEFIVKLVGGYDIFGNKKERTLTENLVPVICLTPNFTYAFAQATAQAEQVQAEQVQAEQVQAEQVQAEQVKAEQVKAEQVKAEQAQAQAATDKTDIANTWGLGFCLRWRLPMECFLEIEGGRQFLVNKGYFKLSLGCNVLGLIM